MRHLLALTGRRQHGFPEELPYKVFSYRVIRVWQMPPAQLLAGGLGILLGLRHSPAVAEALLQGVLSMKESTTYQALVQEGLREGRALGAVLEARKLLLRLGSKKLGRPSARTQAALAKITDLGRLEALVERLETVESWHALLDAPAERS
jgi:hypothetical protein